MEKFIEATGKTIDLAIKNGLEMLQMDRDSVSVTVLAQPRSGFFGIGASPAKVKLTYEVPDPEQEKQPEPVTAKPVQKAEKTEKVEKAEKANKPEPAEAKIEHAERPDHYRSERTERPAAEKPAAQPKVKKPTPVVEKTAASQTIYSPDAEGPVEQRIEVFLKGLLEHMGSDAVPVATKNADDNYSVELTGENLGMLIGRHGDTLDAIQHITNYTINHGQNRRVRVSVDAENYRAKREESLQHLATKVAAKVTRSHRNITLEPMNAYERHVIHAALQDYPDVTTYSTGTEPNRRIVVAYSKYRSFPDQQA